VPPIALPQLGVLAVGGIVVGLILLWRGFGDYRSASRIADTSSSRISSLAAGEVRVSGAVEPAEVTLVSPLQSVPCVWYRAKVTRSTDDSEHTVFEEERGVGFRLRDATDSIRVFPRGAALDVPNSYDEKTGMFGEEPIGLVPRQGSAFGPGAVATPADRAAQITALLTVHPAGSTATGQDDGLSSFGRTGLGALGFSGSGRMRYQEARIEPGEAITVLGMALPFSELPDPLDADTLDGALDPLSVADPEIALDLAAARAAGILERPEDAWGNAAIPGFGIGRPVTVPELDPGVRVPELATPDEAAMTNKVFDLEPNLLVLASTPEQRLLVAEGTPGQVVVRYEQRFLLGLLGAVIAIASALALAYAISGGFR
jgi:hypothetical protein